MTQYRSPASASGTVVLVVVDVVVDDDVVLVLVARCRERSRVAVPETVDALFVLATEQVRDRTAHAGHDDREQDQGDEPPP